MSTLGPTVRIGDVELDVPNAEIRKGAERVRLQEQPLRVLVALAERPGQIVTRKELHARLWPDDTFVDFDNNLNGAIRKLRETLGDSTEEPRYIETVPRRGYRLVATVSTAEPPQRLTSRVAWLAATVVAAGITWWWSSRDVPSVEPTPAKSYLAVLPFRSFDAEASTDYFSDGLTEEIITELARLDPGRLGVIARTSVFVYKDTDGDVREIAKELGVEYVLEGSVRREGETLRITAQLIRADDQSHVWADSFDGDADAVLRTQASIAQDVSTSLRSLLALPPVDRLAHTLSAEPAAVDAYWKGKFHWNLRTREGVSRSLAFFEQALEHDPKLAVAHAALADAYNYQALFGFAPAADAFINAKKSASKALAQEPALPDARAALGFALLHHDRDWARAGEELEAAIALEPGRAIVHHWIAAYYTIVGRHDEALAASRTAQRLDPLSLNVNTDLAWYYYYAGRLSDAVNQARRTLDLDPRAPGLGVLVMLSLRQLGQHQAGLEELRAILVRQNVPEDQLATFDELCVNGETDGAWGWFTRLLERQASAGRGSSYLLAGNYAMAGNVDGALESIATAFDRDESWTPYLAVDPIFDALAGNDRFEQFVARLELP